MRIIRCLFLLGLMQVFFSCGTTGHITIYNFERSKYYVQTCLFKFINDDFTHLIPEKWHNPHEGDVVERFYIYFPDKPEEMYSIGFAGDSTSWANASTCRLGLIGVYNGDTWKFDRDLSDKEEARMQKRFEEEILSKMDLPYEKSN